MKNKFCSFDDITNEAGVEKLFVDRLLEDLGYEDTDISLKESISEFAVGKGSKKVLYKPDYIIKSSGVPSIVIDAKSPKVNVDDFESQCSSYCLELNKEFDYNPVNYYILSNASLTTVYQWDKSKPLITLSFDDFYDGNGKYQELIELLSKSSFRHVSAQLKEDLNDTFFEYDKISLEQLANKFRKLHQEIWQSEKKGPGAAFQELIKIFFVKIRKDRDIHLKLGASPRPKYKDVVFSLNWIATQSEVADPINDILFKNLLNELEKDIQNGRKKRFFSSDEKINLSSGTLKKIVKEIEHVDLFGMEEDIHGRMFEAFLDATIRGKDIGQFFTPRDVVSLMVGIGDPKVTKTHVDKVLDACCGSGGFLISALSGMLSKLKNMKNVSSKEREILDEKIKLHSIFGIDAGSDPSMFKIARMNMYLHGDGGSNIYYADSLDKRVGKVGGESLEVDKQLDELREMLINDGMKFDLILSNPPFSLQYTRENKEQAEILNQYTLSKDRSGGKIINKLISSVMFIERYKDLINDDGKIVAVIDDSVLSGSSYAHVRDYIRDNFIIEGVVSLPGDSFRRASARVKTSIIILKKKKDKEKQSDVFMMSSIYAGIEDKTAKRIGLRNVNLEEKKKEERDLIIKSFKAYLDGADGDFVVPFNNCLDRLDVKYCVNDRGRKSSVWLEKGYEVKPLGSVLSNVGPKRKVSVEDELQYPLLIVNYDGEVNDGEILDGADSSYSALYEVKEWDLLISNMGFGRGAISVVPPHYAGKYVSNEYTILNAPSKECAVFYWNLLRTKEILGDVFSSTTGMNRGRIKWDLIQHVTVPVYRENDEILQLTKEIESFWSAYAAFMQSKEKHVLNVSKELEVESKESFERWLSFKPPE